MKDKIIRYLNSLSENQLVNIHNEYCYSTNNFDNEIFNTAGLNERLEGITPFRIMCMCKYGTFDPTAEFYTFNGYGNIESISNYRLTDYIYIEDIAEYIIDNNNCLYDFEIERILAEA